MTHSRPCEHIAAKADELMALRDRLEACLRRADTQPARLLDAPLAELRAVGENKMVAA